MGGDFSTTIYPERRVRRASPRHPMCHTLHSFTSFTSSISFTSCCFRTLLSFFASTENSTLLFSDDSTLFAKNHRGWGEMESILSGSLSTLASKSFNCNTYGSPASVANKRLTAWLSSLAATLTKNIGGPCPPSPLFSRIRGPKAVALHVFVRDAPDGSARPGERELFGVEDERADEIRVVIVLHGLPPAGEWSEFTSRFSAKSKSFIRIAGDFWHENPMMHATRFSARSWVKWMLRGLRE